MSRYDDDSAPCVSVIPRIGEDTFARATLEVLHDDTLRVLWWPSGLLAREYRPDEWCEATLTVNGRNDCFTSRHADADRRADHERTAVIA